jgi:serine/threonine protein kinase
MAARCARRRANHRRGALQTTVCTPSLANNRVQRARRAAIDCDEHPCTGGAIRDLASALFVSCYRRGVLTEGSIVGAYRVLRILGQGGMGAVFAAEHTLIGRRAAIKVLLPSFSSRQDIVQRFFNEARAVTQVADPGIVQVFDFGHHVDGSAYIIMELLEGEAMDRRLARIVRFAPAEALRLARLICSSLGAAHAQGIVHRDLKPENIFIVPDPAVPGGERAKILDFGIAKLSRDDDPGKLKTRTGIMMGTPVYMSPEQCRGAAGVDPRSDIYAMGCVLMTMLTGAPPFDADSTAELIAAHLREPPPYAGARVPGLPPVLDHILQRCLAKSPDDRFPSMAELGHALGHAEQALSAPGAAMAPAAASVPVPSWAYPPAATPAPGSWPPPGPPTPSGPAWPALLPHGSAPGGAVAVQTTLASASGQAMPAPGSRRRGILAVVAATSLLAGAVIAVAMLRPRRAAAPATDAPASSVAPATAAPRATAAPANTAVPANTIVPAKPTLSASSPATANTAAPTNTTTSANVAAPATTTPPSNTPSADRAAHASTTASAGSPSASSTAAANTTAPVRTTPVASPAAASTGARATAATSPTSPDAPASTGGSATTAGAAGASSRGPDRARTTGAVATDRKGVEAGAAPASRGGKPERKRTPGGSHGRPTDDADATFDRGD